MKLFTFRWPDIFDNLFTVYVILFIYMTKNVISCDIDLSLSNYHSLTIVACVNEINIDNILFSSILVWDLSVKYFIPVLLYLL